MVPLDGRGNGAVSDVVVGGGDNMVDGRAGGSVVGTDVVVGGSSGVSVASGR